MGKLRLPAFHDIARLVGSDVDETEANLYEYYANPDGAPFNYQRARKFARFAFGRMLPLQQILDSCQNERTDQGRKSNEEVLRRLWNVSEGRAVRTYELGARWLAIRKDLRIRVQLPFYFVESGSACTFWLQPRKTYALDLGDLGLLASMVKLAVLVDDFQDVDFEVCDMSSAAAGRPRETTTYRLGSFDVLSEEQTRAKLQLLAIAYD